jgi:hypothetical protein
MLKFNDLFLTEEPIMNDTVGHDTGERHMKQYYSHEVFDHLDGRYILRKDHPHFGSAGSEVKLNKIGIKTDAKGKTRYHGIVGRKSIPMSMFKKPPIGKAGKNNQTRLEDNQIKELHSSIRSEIKKNGGKPIRMRLNGKIHNVSGIKKVPGTPKADAYLHDEKGNPIHYMSLKGDKFQQWGGHKNITEHPVMKDAIAKLKAIKDSINPGEKYLPKASAYHVSLDSNNPDHRDLLMKSMYGHEHGGEYGINNVHSIYSGNTIGIKKTKHKSGNVFEFNPNALYKNTNDKNSDVTDSKILVTNRAGVNQLGTGGRVMVIHKNSSSNSKEAPQITQKKMKPKPNMSVPAGTGEHGGVSFESPADKAQARSMRGK